MMAEAMFILTKGRPVPNVRGDKNIFVLSVLDDRIVDHQLTEEEIIFCDQAQKIIYNTMEKLMPTSADGKQEHLYLVPTRNKLSLQKNSTSPIHATCCATKYMDHVLCVQLDSQNPNINDSLSDLFMNQLVGQFAKKKVQIRRLLIVFGREYVVNTSICYKNFGPCLEIITMFYNKLPDDKFNITTALVENLTNEVK